MIFVDIIYSRVVRILLEVTETQVGEFKQKEKVSFLLLVTEGFTRLEEDLWEIRSQGLVQRNCLQLSVFIFPWLCLSLLGFILQVGRFFPCVEKKVAGRPRFIPSQIGNPSRKRASFSQSLSINPRKDLDWSHMSPFPTPLIKVSQLLLCIRITLGTFGNSDSQTPPAEIPISVVRKTTWNGEEVIFQNKGTAAKQIQKNTSVKELYLGFAILWKCQQPSLWHSSDTIKRQRWTKSMEAFVWKCHSSPQLSSYKWQIHYLFT